MKLFLPFTLLFFLFPNIIHAASWSYPLEKYSERQSDKTFGQYFDKQWYIGKTDRFPSQFTGYHAALDLEIFPEEQNQPVPVYAISSGKIVFSGSVGGYGGLVLIRLAGLDLTALYGHLNLINSPFKVGDSVAPGSRIAYLGDAFSNQTGGERKHLHFGIYKGTDLYFKGYEPTVPALNSHWIDPQKFLLSHISPTPINPTNVPETKNNSMNFLQSIVLFFQRLFHLPR